MAKPAWTEEDIAAAERRIETLASTLGTTDSGGFHIDFTVAGVRALACLQLDLLAGLRQDIANFLRDPNIIETPSQYLEHLLPLLRDVMEAAAQGVEARPLLPSDGPPEREGR